MVEDVAGAVVVEDSIRAAAGAETAPMVRAARVKRDGAAQEVRAEGSVQKPSASRRKPAAGALPAVAPEARPCVSRPRPAAGVAVTSEAGYPVASPAGVAAEVNQPAVVAASLRVAAVVNQPAAVAVVNAAGVAVVVAPGAAEAVAVVVAEVAAAVGAGVVRDPFRKPKSSGVCGVSGARGTTEPS